MKQLIALTLAILIGATVTTAQVSTPGQITATGSFTGANDHITTGGVTVVKTQGGGAVVILDRDFSLDGAPDPKVGFGKNGTYAEATDLGALTMNDGMQVFVVPAHINVDDFNEVYIWCAQFAVSLGMAPLSPPA